MAFRKLLGLHVGEACCHLLHIFVSVQSYLGIYMHGVGGPWRCGYRPHSGPGGLYGIKLGTGCLGGGHPVLDSYIYVHNLTACKLSGASISFSHLTELCSFARSSEMYVS